MFVAIKENVYDENGYLICSISLTPRQKEILDCKDRLDGESWLAYRNRTNEELEQENKSRYHIAGLFAGAYNMRLSAKNENI